MKVLGGIFCHGEMFGKFAKALVLAFTFMETVSATWDPCHFYVLEAWKAIMSKKTHDKGSSSWVQESVIPGHENSKFNDTLFTYIPNALADCVARQGFFASDDDILDFKGATPDMVTYNGANLNAWLFNNVIRLILKFYHDGRNLGELLSWMSPKSIGRSEDFFILDHHTTESGLQCSENKQMESICNHEPQIKEFLKDYEKVVNNLAAVNAESLATETAIDSIIELLGKILQIRALIKYNYEFSDEAINSAISDIKIYIKQLDINEYLKDMSKEPNKRVDISPTVRNVPTYLNVIMNEFYDPSYMCVVGLGNDKKLRIFRKEVTKTGNGSSQTIRPLEHYVYLDKGQYKEATFNNETGEYDLTEKNVNDDQKRITGATVDIGAVESPASDSADKVLKFMEALLGKKYHNRSWQNNTVGLPWATIASQVNEIDISALFPIVKDLSQQKTTPKLRTR